MNVSGHHTSQGLPVLPRATLVMQRILSPLRLL
jgi:hypothetical protein